MIVNKEKVVGVSSRKKVNGFKSFTPLEEALMTFDSHYTSYSSLFETLSAVLNGVEKVALYTLANPGSKFFTLHYEYPSGGATPTELVYQSYSIKYKKGNRTISFDFVDLPNYHLSTNISKDQKKGERILIPIIKRNGEMKVKGLLVVEGTNMTFKSKKPHSTETFLTFFAQLSFRVGREMDYMDISGLPKRNGSTKEDILAWLGGSKTIGIVFFDINNLKWINDNHGHVAGDEIIKNVGETIKNNIILSKSLPFRWGGDEFLVLLKDVDEIAARHVAERIIKSFSELNIGVSGGVVTGQVSSMNDLNRLIDEADKASYNSKRLSKENKGNNFMTYMVNGQSAMILHVAMNPKLKESKLQEEIKNYYPLTEILPS